MEHLLLSSIFHNIFKYVVFQRCQKALLWSEGLNFLHAKFQNSSCLDSSAGWFEFDMVGNLYDRFSKVTAQLIHDGWH